MGNRIYVGNLSFQTTEDSVRTVFAEIGEVTEVQIVLDRMSGQSRGFGFVTMGSGQATTDAISRLNGALLDGRALRVNEAEERQARDGGSRNAGGGGGGQRKQRW
jgi:RNA recognition motif-containing protein